MERLTRKLIDKILSELDGDFEGVKVEVFPKANVGLYNNYRGKDLPTRVQWEVGYRTYRGSEKVDSGSVGFILFMGNKSKIDNVCSELEAISSVAYKFPVKILPLESCSFYAGDSDDE